MELLPASHFSIDQITGGYNQTRVDYLVPMPMTVRRLQEYIDVYDVDLDASCVAMDGDEMLGLCMTGIREGRGWITRLGVLPTTRRRGTGRLMMEYCLDQLRQRRLPIVYLEVIIGNTPALRLFESLGFYEVRRLLVLRRPPGTPPANHHPPQAALTWLSAAETVAAARTLSWREAWTNQPESLANAASLRGLRVQEEMLGREGWVSFEALPLQLRRVIIGPRQGRLVAPGYSLLHHLHARYPTLDTIAENVPADAPHLDAFYAHGYVESFARIEMELKLGS